MAAHKGPASSRPRCTRGGSSVAVMPIYHLERHLFPKRPCGGTWKEAHLLGLGQMDEGGSRHGASLSEEAQCRWPLGWGSFTGNPKRYVR
jgi:hypothetical protein